MKKIYKLLDFYDLKFKLNNSLILDSFPRLKHLLTAKWNYNLKTRFILFFLRFLLIITMFIFIPYSITVTIIIIYIFFNLLVSYSNSSDIIDKYIYDHFYNLLKDKKGDFILYRIKSINTKFCFNYLLPLIISALGNYYFKGGKEYLYTLLFLMFFIIKEVLELIKILSIHIGKKITKYKIINDILIFIILIISMFFISVIFLSLVSIHEKGLNDYFYLVLYISLILLIFTIFKIINIKLYKKLSKTAHLLANRKSKIKKRSKDYNFKFTKYNNIVTHLRNNDKLKLKRIYFSSYFLTSVFIIPYLLLVNIPLVPENTSLARIILLFQSFISSFIIIVYFYKLKNIFWLSGEEHNIFFLKRFKLKKEDVYKAKIKSNNKYIKYIIYLVLLMKIMLAFNKEINNLYIDVIINYIITYLIVTTIFRYTLVHDIQNPYINRLYSNKWIGNVEMIFYYFLIFISLGYANIEFSKVFNESFSYYLVIYSILILILLFINFKTNLIISKWRINDDRI